MYLLTELQIYDIIVTAQRATETRKERGQTYAECRKEIFKEIMETHALHELNAPQKTDHECRN